MKFIYTIALLLFPNIIFGQMFSLGSAASFVLFTSSGAVANAGVSTITGNIGSHAGIIGSFGASSVTGSFYTNDSVTHQTKLDLFTGYSQLVSIPATVTAHAAAFGSGETLTTGIYNITGAGSLAGNLILDGLGDTNSIFIFRFGGAYATGAGSSVILVNGARACNVFWTAEGAIAMGVNTTMKGTLIANNGAISMLADGNLEGRMLSTIGAINIGPVVAYLPNCTASIFITSLSCCSPIYGAAVDFLLFTGSGAVSNSGPSTLTGNIGSNLGAITGFETASLIGSFYNANPTTLQAKADLLITYNQLVAIPATITGHAPAFGSSETLTAGVYDIAGAGSLAGILTLDGLGDTASMFIFRFGGAYAIGAASTLILTNGARHCNVFWVSEGAISVGANSIIKGTLIANNAAVSIGGSVNLEGKLLTTAGAITFGPAVAVGSVSTTSLCVTSLPIKLLSFTSECNKQGVLLKWSTATETNNNYFTIERGTNGINWEALSTVSGAGNSGIIKNYSTIDTAPYNHTAYYRLKQTDYDGKFNFSNIVAIENCKENITTLSIYPNPAHDGQNININFASTTKQSVLVTAVDVFGQEYYSKIIVLEKGATLIAIEPYKKLAPGMYVVIAKTSNYKEIFSQKIIIN
jgi:hypothetical protein